MAEIASENQGKLGKKAYLYVVQSHSFCCFNRFVIHRPYTNVQTKEIAVHKPYTKMKTNKFAVHEPYSRSYSKEFGAVISLSKSYFNQVEAVISLSRSYFNEFASLKDPSIRYFYLKMEKILVDLAGELLYLVSTAQRSCSISIYSRKEGN